MADDGEPNARLTLGEIAQSLRLPPSENTELTDVVYIAIASEEWRPVEGEMLEFGIAVFDTGMLASMDFPSADHNPQTLVNAVFATCQYAHFRMVEHARHNNGREVPGRPDHFGFGTSTWIKAADAKRVLQRIFDDPARLHDATNYVTEIVKNDRKVVCVRHGMETLDDHLSALGENVTDLPGLVACYDTQTMGGSNAGSLAKVMAALCLKPVNLRNTGNEAAYTLHAVIIAAVLECYGHGVVSKCCNAITTEPALVNVDAKAAVTWGGTAVEGDEVKLAMSGKKTRAMKRFAEQKRGYAQMCEKMRGLDGLNKARRRAQQKDSELPASKRARTAKKPESQQEVPAEYGGQDQPMAQQAEHVGSVEKKTRALPQAGSRRKASGQSDRFFHNLGRR